MEEREGEQAAVQHKAFTEARIDVARHQLHVRMADDRQITLTFKSRWGWFVELLAFIAHSMQLQPTGKVAWAILESEIERLRTEGKTTFRATTTGVALATSFHKIWYNHLGSERRGYFTCDVDLPSREKLVRALFGVEHANQYACYYLAVDPDKITIIDAEPQVAVPPRQAPDPDAGGVDVASAVESVPSHGEHPMPDLNKIVDLLDEAVVAQQVGLLHDQARESYHLQQITVNSMQAFYQEIANYYRHHMGIAGMNLGGPAPLSDAQAVGEAEQILKSAFSDEKGTIALAYSVASSGIQGGMRSIVNALAEALKMIAVEQYIDHVIRTHVTALSYAEQVDVMRQYLARYGQLFPAGQAPTAEELASNYQVFIKKHAEILNNTRRSHRR